MRRLATLVVACVAGAATVAYGQQATHALTLSEALDLMRAHNPTLLSGRAHVDATRASEVTAGLRPNPVFTSSNEDFKVFTPAGLTRVAISNTQEFTENVSQLFERGGKRGARMDSARWTTSLTRDSLQDTERQLELNLKTTFVALLLAKSNLELAKANVADYAQTLKLNEVRLKAGEISPTEFDRLRAQEADFQADALNAELSVSQARIGLQALLGVTEPGLLLEVQGELEPPELAVTLDGLQKLALANRPDYLAARDAIARATADVRLSDANGATDFEFGAEYKRNNFDNTLGFTFSIPLRIFDRNQGEKQRTRFEVDASRAAEEAARAQVLADVTQAYETYRIALARTRIYSADYLARARSVRDRTEFSYRQRATTLLDYLDALHTYRAIELAARSANAAALTAVHQLSFVTGTEMLK